MTRSFSGFGYKNSLSLPGTFLILLERERGERERGGREREGGSICCFRRFIKGDKRTGEFAIKFLLIFMPFGCHTILL